MKAPRPSPDDAVTTSATASARSGDAAAANPAMAARAMIPASAVQMTLRRLQSHRASFDKLRMREWLSGTKTQRKVLILSLSKDARRRSKAQPLLDGRWIVEAVGAFDLDLQ